MHCKEKTTCVDECVLIIKLENKILLLYCWIWKNNKYIGFSIKNLLIIV